MAPKSIRNVYDFLLLNCAMTLLFIYSINCCEIFASESWFADDIDGWLQRDAAFPARMVNDGAWSPCRMVHLVPL